MHKQTTRLGIHYFADGDHFTQSDIAQWLPRLQEMGIGWLTLAAPHNRCIPEYFIQAIRAGGIEPVLHFDLPLGQPLEAEQFSPLLKAYARWGVRYCAFYDRPNLRAAWPVSAWSQNELVERFLDHFLPLAECALQADLIPVFSPLEPGGDYWDTAFLRASLRSLRRRASDVLRRELVVGAYGWCGNRPIDWGRGGPEAWPGVRPYLTPPGEQDQRGFRIFDWYAPLAAAELDDPCPILLLGAGARLGDRSDPANPAIDTATHAQRNLEIAQFLLTEASQGTDGPPDHLLSCNFWLLAAGRNSPHAAQAWFQPDGETLPIVPALIEQVKQAAHKATTQAHSSTHKPLEHYLLLSGSQNGLDPWQLEVIRPFILRHKPTIGFSLEEAHLARRVTVLDADRQFNAVDIHNLRQSGCVVNQIEGNGTEIATILAS